MMGENSDYVHSVSRDSNYIIYNNAVSGRSLFCTLIPEASYLSEFDELQAVSLTLDPNIICITESWLSSEIED